MRPDGDRRAFLAAGLVGAAGVGLGAAGASAYHASADENLEGTAPIPTEEELDKRRIVGEARERFYGPHQAGIAEPPLAHGAFITLGLRPETDRSGLERMLRLLSDDAARLTQGRAPLADTEPELADAPARLRVMFALGEKAVALAGVEPPSWLRPLPAFEIDRLEDRWSGGDVLIALQSDDPIALAHAQRMLLKDSRAFCTLTWVQKGFRNARFAAPTGSQRNLFGQIDGTVNPEGSGLDTHVWITDGPFAGGCSMVVRRIAMDVDEWDRVDRAGREFSVGRRMSDGSPLAGGPGENGEADFAAKDERGFHVIGEYSHMRRARLADDGTRHEHEQILRRPFNYDDAPTGSEISNTGLIFVSYQRDVDEQFVPMQQRLSDGDLLNTWTTPIGSAVFVVLPGCREGGFVGQSLFQR